MIEGEAADAGLQRMRGDALVGERRPDAQPRAVDLDLPKPARREPHDDALHAAVAHQKVGAEPEDGDGNFLRQRPHQEGKILRIGRHGQNFRRPAGAKPHDRRQRLVRLQRAAEAGKLVLESVEKMRGQTPAPILLPEGEGGCGAAG